MIADGTTVLLIGPIVIFPFMLLGGFFTNSSALTDWLKYVEKISPLRYGFEAMSWNQWERHDGKALICDEPDLTNPLQLEQCMPEFLGFHYSYWTCIIVMAGMAVVLRLISIIAMTLVIGKFS